VSRKNSRRFVVTFFAIVLSACVLSLEPSIAAIQEANKEPEAREWLKTLNKPDFFDGSRRSLLTFGQAGRFVSKLYSAGAIKIGVIFLAGEPQGFRIELPLDVARRQAVFEVVNRVIERAGFSALRDTGQDDIVIWLRMDAYE
jgi:hypothetical protein